MDEPVIVATNLTKVFGAIRALDDLSFEVPPGRVTGFLGPNGAGKTTAMRIALGLAKPTSGSALVMGRPYASLPQPARVVGVLLDAASFHPRRTARAQLRWMAAVAGVSKQRIDDVLGLVELNAAADRHVGEFSLGMRQRLGLAAALLGEPQLLVLDEPANGLDPSGIRWLREFLRSFAHQGGSVFVSSHLLGEISQLADDVVVINRGRLVAETSVETLTGGSVVATHVRTPEPQRLIAAVSGEGVEIRDLDGARLEIRGMTPEQVGTIAAETGVVLHELVRSSHTLEDVFFSLTQQERDDERVA